MGMEMVQTLVNLILEQIQRIMLTTKDILKILDTSKQVKKSKGGFDSALLGLGVVVPSKLKK